MSYTSFQGHGLGLTDSESPEDVKDSSILRGMIDELSGGGGGGGLGNTGNMNTSMPYYQQQYQQQPYINQQQNIFAATSSSASSSTSAGFLDFSSTTTPGFNQSHHQHPHQLQHQHQPRPFPAQVVSSTYGSTANAVFAPRNANSDNTTEEADEIENTDDLVSKSQEREPRTKSGMAVVVTEDIPDNENSESKDAIHEDEEGIGPKAGAEVEPDKKGSGTATGPATDSNTSKVKRTRSRRPASCDNCRKKKFRCDRLLPCETCKQRGEEDTCTYGNGATPLHIQRGSDETAELRIQVDRLREIVEALTRAAPSVAATSAPAVAAPATPSSVSTAPLVPTPNIDDLATNQQQKSSSTVTHLTRQTTFIASITAAGGDPSPRFSTVDFDSPRQVYVTASHHHQTPNHNQNHSHHHASGHADQHHHENRPSSGGEGTPEEPAIESLRKMNLKALDICEALGQLSVTGVVRLDGAQPYNVPLMKEARAALGTPGVGSSSSDGSNNHNSNLSSAASMNNLGTFPFSSSPDSIEKIMEILPSLEQAATVITCFKRQLSWYIYFFPWSVFERQLHTLRTSTTSNVDCSFLSIFLGVCGIGLYFLPDKQATAFPQGKGKIDLATSWLDASASALTLARFLDCPSLNSIHAMQLLTAWHVYLSPGDTSSTGFAVLNIAAEAVLQLGLHRDPDPAHNTPFEINMRRLTFWQTVMLETQAGSSLGKTWSLFQLQHCDTKLPMEKNEEAFLSNGYLREDFEQTEESIMTSILLRMRTSITSKHISERAFSIQDVSFSTVLELDRELRKLEDSFPAHYKLDFENKELKTAPGLSRLARLKTCMVNVGLLQEYIRLHRPFVASGSSFEICRSTCLRAARITIAIFKELAVFNYGGLTFKAMMASCVVCMDLITHPDSSESASMREDVNAVIALLDKNKDRSKLADNGVRIIRFLLAKSSPAIEPSPPTTLSLTYDIRSHDATLSGPGAAAFAYGLNKRARVDGDTGRGWYHEPTYSGLVAAAPISAASSVSPQSSNGDVQRDGKRRQTQGTPYTGQPQPHHQHQMQPTPRSSPSTSATTSDPLHGVRMSSNEQYPLVSPPAPLANSNVRTVDYRTNSFSTSGQENVPMQSNYNSSRAHSMAPNGARGQQQYYSNVTSTYAPSTASSSSGLHTPATSSSQFPTLTYAGAYHPHATTYIQQQQQHPSVIRPPSDEKTGIARPISSTLFDGSNYPSFNQTLNNFIANENIAWQAPQNQAAPSFTQHWQQQR